MFTYFFIFLGLVANPIDPLMLTGFATTAHTIAGGFLFGVGAVINGGCVFGTIARLSSGEVTYIAIIPGFVVGVMLSHLLGLPLSAVAAGPPPIVVPFYIPMAFVLPLAFVLTFVARRLRTAWRLRKTWHVDVWSPAFAMAIIGVAGGILGLIQPNWSPSTLLMSLATGGYAPTIGEIVLPVLVFTGATIGAITGGRFALQRPRLIPTLHSLVGGTAMGVAATMIPGGNDALLLGPLPLLWPFAITAYTALAIGAAIALLMPPPWRSSLGGILPQGSRAF